VTQWLSRNRCRRVPVVVEQRTAIGGVVAGPDRISIFRRRLAADVSGMTLVSLDRSNCRHLVDGRVRHSDPDRKRHTSRNFRRGGGFLREYDAVLLSRLGRLMFDGRVEPRRAQLIDRRDRRLPDHVGNEAAALRSPARLFGATASDLLSLDRLVGELHRAVLRR